MLADTPPTVGLGSLTPGVHQPGTFLLQLVDFVADALPSWRDHPDRQAVDSETELTAQLGAHLNGLARRSLDIVQFMTEVPDSVQRGRTIDMSVQPCGTTIYVEGRSYTQFQVLLPIECKRLPTPPDPRRGEREYVIANTGATTGGIQRFKIGAHGAAHSLALMIGYIQEGDTADWLQRVNTWIADVGTIDALWAGEQLSPLTEQLTATDRNVHRFSSNHRRQGAPSIELRHLWIILDLPGRRRRRTASKARARSARNRS